MSETIVTVGITANGEEHTWTVEITNISGTICYDASLTLTIPTGISLIGPLLSGSMTEIDVVKGAYDPVNDIWQIGNIDPGQTISTDFEFRVDDISQADPIDDHFLIEGQLNSSCLEVDDCDNKTSLILKVGDVCDTIDLSAGADTDEDCENEIDLVIS